MSKAHSSLEAARHGLRKHGATIRNCHFQFKCPKYWNELKDDGLESNSRYCTSCEKRVYICKSTQELEGRASAGECVAIYSGASAASFASKGDQESFYTLGVPARRKGTSLDDDSIEF